MRAKSWHASASQLSISKTRRRAARNLVRAQKTRITRRASQQTVAHAALAGASHQRRRRASRQTQQKIKACAACYRAKGMAKHAPHRHQHNGSNCEKAKRAARGMARPLQRRARQAKKSIRRKAATGGERHHGMAISANRRSAKRITENLQASKRRQTHTTRMV